MTETKKVLSIAIRFPERTAARLRLLAAWRGEGMDATVVKLVEESFSKTGLTEPPEREAAEVGK